VTTRHTDFVLAVMAQRAGLLGLALVFGLVALVVHEARVTARRSGEPSARVAASAVAAGLVAQAVIHVAGVAGVLPLTGVALPGVSFGGSALVALLASVGLVVGLARTPPAQASPCGTSEPAP
jgi:cell division protein FtsW